MKDYNNKLVEFQPVSANGGAGFLIRNGRMTEEYYLKDIRTERGRDLNIEYEFHLPGTCRPLKRKKKEEKEAPETCAVATWTKDESEAMYFETMRDAQKLIEKWHVIRMARPTIVRG